RDRSVETGSLAALLGRLNALIHSDLGGVRFMTMYLAMIDGTGKSMRWSTAGHDPAIIYDPANDTFTESEEGGGLPLGIMEGAGGYEEARTDSLAAGQIIFIGTDGIWEMQDVGGQEFGKDRLKDIIRANASQSAKEIETKLLAELDKFRGEAPRRDDVTFVII